MISKHATDKAAWLMSEFAMRPAVAAKQDQRRYLWTDAFAVCNFLELFERTGDQEYRRRATELIDQVHRVLGRYRDDDSRSGWISGLDEQADAAIQRPAVLGSANLLKERECKRVARRTAGVGSGRSILPLPDQMDTCPLPNGLCPGRPAV